MSRGTWSPLWIFDSGCEGGPAIRMSRGSGAQMLGEGGGALGYL